MGDAQTVPLAELETVPVRVLQSSGEVAYAASMPKTSTIKDWGAGRLVYARGGQGGRQGISWTRNVMTKNAAGVLI